jgi:nucleoside-diphosphate-sugar epimerase
MRVVVTGAGGFIGWFLTDELIRRGADVQAWVRTEGPCDWSGNVDVVAVDVCDQDAISRQLFAFKPALIVHLAAQSLPGRSWEKPAATYQTNVGGAINLLESVRTLVVKPRLLVAGSSAEYADATDGQPIAENALTQPNSPYAASKLAAWQAAQLYASRYGLDIIGFRPFFLAGPRKTGDACSDFARRIVAIEQGRETEIRVGTLDVVRDIIDVRDGVRGILRIAEAGKSGEMYNVAGGHGVTIRDVLDSLIRLAVVPVKITSDPALMRPLDQQVRVGDARKLRALGWEPKHDLAGTLRAILDYWRSAELRR